MPEKSSKAIHHKQQHYSYDVSVSEEHNGGKYEDYDSSDDVDDELQDIGELLGFRITGGKDFFMPITIFHVKEDSRAEKACLKLGDAILSINGRNTEDMTLVQANRFLAKVADADVLLQVAKFDANDDDDYVQTIEEVLLEGPESLQQKLKMMQRQLLDMTDIPPQIQSKIAMVTKALEQFMTMDPEALRASMECDEEDADDEGDEEEETGENGEEEDGDESQDEKQFSTIEEEIEDEEGEDIGEEMDARDESTRETSYSFDDERNFQNIIDEYDGSEEECYEDEEKSDCESILSEEKMKLQEERKKKHEKIQTLQKSWQKLCENQKTIHKRSNCHLVPSVALLNNKISQLNESKVISFYERKRCPSSD